MGSKDFFHQQFQKESDQELSGLEQDYPAYFKTSELLGERPIDGLVRRMADDKLQKAANSTVLRGLLDQLGIPQTPRDLPMTQVPPEFPNDTRTLRPQGFPYNDDNLERAEVDRHNQGVFERLDQALEALGQKYPDAYKYNDTIGMRPIDQILQDIYNRHRDSKLKHPAEKLKLNKQYKM